MRDEGCLTERNYVVFSIDEDYIDAMLSDLKGLSYVQIRPKVIDSKSVFVRALFRLHWSRKVNHKIQLPLKRLWFNTLSKNSFDNNKPICYLYLGGREKLAQNGFIDYVKAYDPSSSNVLIFLDRLKAYSKAQVEQLKQMFDLVFSYDPIEAKEYDVEFLPYFFGKSGLLEFRGEPENDVYFVGYAKNRLPEILAAYRALTERQLRCDFRIVGVNECDRVYVEGIKYSGQIPYEQATREMLNAKCILDVTQKGAAGPSLRVAESILYHRKLLSDNAALLDSYMYNPEHMLVFSSVGDAEAEFVKAPLSNEVYRDSDIMSSVELLEFIDNKL